MDYGDMIRPGTEVKFRRQYGNISGVIKAVWVAESGVQYQISYLHNGTMHEPYVPREMFEVVESQPIPAGFRLPGPK